MRPWLRRGGLCRDRAEKLTMRLGRKPHDPAALAAMPTLGAHLMPEPPAKLDRSALPFHPACWNNDTQPDCTAASLAECAKGANLIFGGGELNIALDAPIRFYAACIGTPNATMEALAATDGAVMADVARIQSVEGYDIGQAAPMTGLPANVPLARAYVAACMASLGHVWLGVTLHERDMEPGQVWDVSADDGAAIGGHAIMGFDYDGLGDGDHVRISTWGAWRLTTWRWLDARLAEAHGVIWRQWTPPGFDVAALEADVARWAGFGGR
ncbi:MAG: hypothetical protein KGL39_50215 [Patescibacteria group bacterium]|nr:hypothetical protein [Patescibacteria group bacterium]